MLHVPNRYRVRQGAMATTDADGCNGAFIIPRMTSGKPNAPIAVICSDGGGWEHVSVSYVGALYFIPSWEVMCAVKRLFWDPEDCVMQLHPPESEYVNHHPGTLHLWRPIGQEIPRPPSIFVGPKTVRDTIR